MTTNKHLIILFLITLFTLSSCKKENESNEATFSLKINGELYKPDHIAAYLSQEASSGNQRFDIRTSNDKYVIHLAFEQDQINDCMNTGSYEPDYILIMVSYKLSNGNTVCEHHPMYDNDGNMMFSLEIKSCQNKTISGVFTGTLRKVGSLQTEIDTPQVIEITDGKFENIKYVINQI